MGIPSASPQPQGPALESIAERIETLRRTAGGPAWPDVARVMTDGGPAFAACASYLATRLDVLPLEICAALARVPTWSTLVSPDELTGVLTSAFGRPVAQVFEHVDPVPFDTRFPIQSHRARLGPAHAVVVRFVVPGGREMIRAAAPLLGRLLPVLGGLGERGDARYVEAALRRVTDEFAALLGRRMDLAGEVAGGRAIVTDALQFPLLRPRRPRTELCGPTVSVWDDLATVSLDAPGADRASAALTAMVVWLRQSLLGRAFPEEPEACDMLFVDRGQVALAHGPCRTMTPAQQATLQSYLVATAANEPDWALECVAPLLVPSASADRAGLQRRFRHAPLPWDDALFGRSQLLAQLVTHWQLIGRYGFEAQPVLAAWYRACVMATASASSHGATEDVLHEAVRMLQPRIAARHVGHLVGMPDWQGRGAGAMLSRLATAFGTSPADLFGGATLGATRPPPRTGVIAGLLMVFASLTFVVPSLERVIGRSADILAAFGVLAAGGSAIWLIVRRRTRGAPRPAPRDTSI